MLKARFIVAIHTRTNQRTRKQEFLMVGRDRRAGRGLRFPRLSPCQGDRIKVWNQRLTLSINRLEITLTLPL